jgi:hypothetical protein
VQNIAFADLRTIFLSWKVTPVLALLVLPSWYATSTSDEYALFGEADFFALIVSFALPLIFPLIAVAIFALPFSSELSHRYILYTRTRTNVSRYLQSKLLTNIAVAFVVFFLASFIPFLWAFVVEPAIGVIGPFRPTVAGLSPTELEAYPASVYTFSQLLSFGPWAYGLGYSLWLGLNGALYASIGFLLLFVIPNRFIALSIPFIGYHILNFVFAVLGIPQFSPTMVFPFNLVQFPIWVAFVPFSIMALLAASLAFYVGQRTQRLDVLL